MSAPALEAAAMAALAAIEAARARGDRAAVDAMEIDTAMVVHRLWQAASPSMKMLLELAVDDGGAA